VGITRELVSEAERLSCFCSVAMCRGEARLLLALGRLAAFLEVVLRGGVRWFAPGWDMARHPLGSGLRKPGNKSGNKTPPNTMTNRDTRGKEMLEKPTT
jgi:hypothetical protein